MPSGLQNGGWRGTVCPMGSNRWRRFEAWFQRQTLMKRFWVLFAICTPVGLATLVIGRLIMGDW